MRAIILFKVSPDGQLRIRQALEATIQDRDVAATASRLVGQFQFMVDVTTATEGEIKLLYSDLVHLVGVQTAITLRVEDD